MVYTQELDDGEGNGFWKPSLLQFDGITFYLQVEKCGKSKNWYFYIQMEGSLKDCEKYGTMIKVGRSDFFATFAYCLVDDLLNLPSKSLKRN